MLRNCVVHGKNTLDLQTDLGVYCFSITHRQLRALGLVVQFSTTCSEYVFDWNYI